MIRVLIADDHPIIRHGFRNIIEKAKGICVAAEASNGYETIEKIRNGKFDILTLDIQMPGLNGVQVLKQLKNENILIPTIVLSIYPEEQYAIRALKAGASGYLTKEAAGNELIEAIRKVACGKKYIGSSLASKLVEYLNTNLEDSPHELLSDREFSVLRYIASGKTVKEIAGKLNLSTNTVSTYRARILQKMNMHTNAELTHYAVKSKIVD